MLRARTWEPVAYTLRGHPITFKVKRLDWFEFKPFDVALAKIRWDLLTADLVRLQQQAAEIDRTLLTRLQDVARDAGLLPLPPEADEGAYLAQLRDAGVAVPLLTDDEIEQQRAAIARVLAERAAALEAFYASVPDPFVRRVCTDYIKDVTGIIDDETGDPVTTGAGLLAYLTQDLALFIIGRINRVSRLEVDEGNVSSSPSISGQEAEIAAGRSTVAPAGPVAGPTPGTVTATPIAASASLSLA